MLHCRTVCRCLVAAVAAGTWVSGPAVAQPPELLDEAFERYWAADSPDERTDAASLIVSLDPRFDDVYTRLRAGRPYSADVETGRRRLMRRNRDGLAHDYLVVVPDDYDSARRYPVHMYLHGGVSAPKGTPRWRDPSPYLNDEAVVVFPEAWRQSLWWNESQVENLAGIVRDLKRQYNLDENRVFLLGISDGGSGLFYQASRDTTPWAGFLPFISHPAVVASPRTGVDGQLYVRNMAEKPFLIVNLDGGRLYPAARVRPFVETFEAAGMPVRFVVRPESGHHMRWWPDERDRIDDFLMRTTREAVSDRLAWETDRTDAGNRNHWLLVTELGEADGQAALDALNTVVLAVSPARPQGLVRRMFPRDRPSGRIVLRRAENVVTAETAGIAGFTILVSPDRFDLSHPIRILVNGRTTVEQHLEPDVRTLMHWAVRDDDRTMLFAAELTVRP